MQKLYLAYGSNLDHRQMKMRCPDAAYLGKTEVKNYTLLYRGNYRDYGVNPRTARMYQPGFGR